MMAACKNVETYAAAQVFYWVGFNGMAYVLDVFMADTSSLKNRALVFAFSTTPYMLLHLLAQELPSLSSRPAGSDGDTECTPSSPQSSLCLS